jgi:hypothetical protein
MLYQQVYLLSYLLRPTGANKMKLSESLADQLFFKSKQSKVLLTD